MLTYLIAIFLGIFFGIFTGLIPGIHVNLISLITISLFPLINKTIKINSIYICCFIISLSITHTFLDAIPSIFLGAPDSNTVLGVLPGHRYLLKGLGYQALKLTVIGSLFSLIVSILLFPVFVYIIKYTYLIIKDYIVFILIIITIYMILRDNKKITSLIVFLISGVFGYLVLNNSHITNPLFPMLSGMYGVSTLAYSLNSTFKIPPQRISKKIFIKPIHFIKAILSSSVAGFITSLLPGVGSSQGAVIAMQLARNIGDHGFMILMGGINTVNFTLSLATFYVLNKARNGSIVSIQKIINSLSTNNLIIFISSALIAGCVSVFLALFFGRIFSKIISKVNYKSLIISIISFITILTFLISDKIGVFILIISFFIGLIPAITKCSRTHAMGCLILPTIFYLINF